MNLDSGGHVNLSWESKRYRSRVLPDLILLMMNPGAVTVTDDVSLFAWTSGGMKMDECLDSLQCDGADVYITVT
jgi:hypothetical protein